MRTADFTYQVGRDRDGNLISLRGRGPALSVHRFLPQHTERAHDILWIGTSLAEAYAQFDAAKTEGGK